MMPRSGSLRTGEMEGWGGPGIGERESKREAALISESGRESNRLIALYTMVTTVQNGKWDENLPRMFRR